MRLKGITIRLFPNRDQKRKLFQSAGTYRFVWNWGLALNESLHKQGRRHLTGYELSNEFTKLRNSPGYTWLQEVSRIMCINALRDLYEAYKNFYRRQKSGEHGGFPKFKAKYQGIPSFAARSERVKIKNGRIYLEKIGYLRMKFMKDLSGVKFHNVRVKYECGKWLMKCSIECHEISREAKLRDVNMGIDLGIKSLAVVSCNGKKRVFKNINKSHRVKRLERQLRHLQRELFRRRKNSMNRNKTRRKLRNIYGKLKHIRHDYINKVTRAIVDMKPKKIVIEDLNVSAMMKNKYLAGAVRVQYFYMFRKCIEQKAENIGIEIIIADKFFASSKICSRCGHKREKLTLSERIYTCPECGLIIDRDYNAALNLEKLAL